jgi:hypothetical protein
MYQYALNKEVSNSCFKLHARPSPILHISHALLAVL